ncbi:MAG: glutathione S-transferase family protein [Thermodesulfobacteriota bacterium]|nr:glutathione S-transferase family protein [Thermodesulfobacteriota bacterium]
MNIIKLYDHELSGNCFKVRLLLNQLSLDFESIKIDVFAGENKKDFFKKINPAMKIPVINDSGIILNESNAILLYLSDKYKSDLLSNSLEDRAKIYSWLMYNKTSVDPFLAKARAIKKFYPHDKQDLDELKSLKIEGNKSLNLINDYLKTSNFFCSGYSIADIAMYPYIKLSYEGEILLEEYNNILNWIDRVENTAKFIPIY